MLHFYYAEVFDVDIVVVSSCKMSREAPKYSQSIYFKIYFYSLLMTLTSLRVFHLQYGLTYIDIELHWLSIPIFYFSSFIYDNNYYEECFPSTIFAFTYLVTLTRQKIYWICERSKFCSSASSFRSVLRKFCTQKHDSTSIIFVGALSFLCDVFHFCNKKSL